MSVLFVSQPCFSISDLARLGVKPRLCRSSWRAFASTHLLMVSSPFLREALLTCSPCPPWNLPSLMVESMTFFHGPALISLSLAKVWLLFTLTLSDPMIWYSGQTALFHFLLTRAALASLPTPFFVALRSLVPFLQSQYV